MSLALPGPRAVVAPKTLFVDGTYGLPTASNPSGAGGARERRDRPYRLLSAAITAAQSGDTIVVLPGTYTGSNLGKSGVAFELLAGVVISASDPALPVFSGLSPVFGNGTVLPAVAVQEDELSPFVLPMWAVYEFDRTASLFQDSAGTTPYTTPGNSIGRATDLSGNGRHATASGSARPSAFPNGAVFDNVAQYLTVPGTPFGAEFTVVAVWRMDVETAFPCLLGGTASSHLNLCGGWDLVSGQTPRNRLCVGRTNQAHRDSQITFGLGEWHISSWRSAGIRNGRACVQIDSNGESSAGVLNLVSLGAALNSTIGAAVPGTSGNLNGLVRRLYVFSKVLTDDELAKVTRYLSRTLSIAARRRVAPARPISPLGLRTWIARRSPVLAPGAGGSIDAGRAESPSVVVHDGAYYVAYGAVDAADPVVTRIALATGASLESLAKQGAILAPAGGTWYSGYVSGQRLHRFLISGVPKWVLYFFGSSNAGFEAEPADIGVAVADLPGGPYVVQAGGPILSRGAGGAWDARILYRAYVVEKDGTYYLFYNAKATADGVEHIGVATSSSPLGPFTKHAGNPVVVATTDASNPGNNWGASRVGDPVIVRDSVTGLYTMLYFGQTDTAYGGSISDNPGRMGLATSMDLLTWTPIGANPIAAMGAGPLIRGDIFTGLDGQLTMLADDGVDSIFVARLGV